MEVMDLQVLLLDVCIGNGQTSLPMYLCHSSFICQKNTRNTAANKGTYYLPMQDHFISTVLFKSCNKPAGFLGFFFP